MIFKNYLKICFKNIKTILFSFMIFMLLLIIFTSQSSKETEFKAMKLDIMINDQDKSEDSKAFINYIKEKHNVTEGQITEDEAKKQIVENKITAFIEIKKDFKQNLLNDKKAISLLASTKTAYITFLKIDLNKYMNYTLAGYKSNVDQKEVIDTLNKEIDVKIVDTKLYNQEESNEAFAASFAILSYVVFMDVISIIINIDSEFKKESLLKRMGLSPYSQKSQMLQQFAAQIIIAIFISAIYISIVLLRINLDMSKANIIYTILAVLVFSFTAISLGQLFVSLSKNVKVINGINAAFTSFKVYATILFYTLFTKYKFRTIFNIHRLTSCVYYILFTISSIYKKLQIKRSRLNDFFFIFIFSLYTSFYISYQLFYLYSLRIKHKFPK